MAKSQIGLSMLYCLGEPFKKMTKHLTETQTSYIEIVDDGFHALNKQRVLTLKNVGVSYGLKYSVHAPFADINIASPSKSMLKAMLKRLEQSIANANALNAYIWVFHPGLATGISMFYPSMDWLQNLKSIGQLLKIAEDYSVKIAIENVPEPYPFLMKNVEQFTKFYNEIDAEIGLVLDVGHANLNGQTALFIKTFSNKIVHIHAHDNNGRSDQHLGIGYGTINWKSFGDMLKDIGYDKVVVVESVEHVKESIRRLKEMFPNLPKAESQFS
ncbi:MAG: sugar phosphate isomerase/epimerase family protein [Candidatus Bathyarchaeia archaeon]